MKVVHMSGAGNDFAVLDARNCSLDFSAMAKKLCSQLGADGFLALDNSEIADFRLHFYNADGNRGEMCGNGARCLCKFAYDMGIAGEHMQVETDAGLIYAWRIAPETYRLQLNLPGLLDLNRLPDTDYVELGDPGTPHCIRELPDLQWEDREALLPLALSLRHNQAFPKGANVNFYTRLAENQVRLLTYERGVEDYTLACGTGSSSVAAVLFVKGLLPEGKLIAENPGGTLTITISGQEPQIDKIFLEGPAEVLQVIDI